MNNIADEVWDECVALKAANKAADDQGVAINLFKPLRKDLQLKDEDDNTCWANHAHGCGRKGGAFGAF